MQYCSGLLYHSIAVQFYITLDVDPEVPSEFQHFASMEAWLHVYRSKPTHRNAA